MKVSCVILAAGSGTRMKSSVPKVLHRVCGIPMIQSVVMTASGLRPEHIIIVAGRHFDRIKEAVSGSNISFALQSEPKGTGHALSCARKALGDFQGTVIVLNGDTPLINPRTISKFLSLHRKRKNAVSVISFIAADPAEYGRIIRNSSGTAVSITENKDADHEQKKICEVNSGIYAIEHTALHLLDEIRMNAGKKEYYLTDIISLSARRGYRTEAFCIGQEDEFMGVNTRQELFRASEVMRKNTVDALADKGVIFMDPGSVFIHPCCRIGQDTTIYPNVHIEGRTTIGKGSVVYPNVRIIDSRIGNGVAIKDSSVIECSQVRDKASVGPFAHLRPGSDIGPGAKVGNFVEMKKAVIGRGSKASHLSYIGDAKVGKGVNIGAGTITCNYDGMNKHLTVIRDGVFIGSDSQLVAPVKVGKGAYIGAGSTITKDVPSGSLALSRAPQRNIMKWAKKRMKKNRSTRS